MADVCPFRIDNVPCELLAEHEGDHQMYGTFERLAMDLEALERAAQDRIDQLKSGRDDLRRWLDSAEAERDRLRVALRDVASLAVQDTRSSLLGDVILEIERRARAALAPETAPQEETA